MINNSKIKRLAIKITAIYKNCTELHIICRQKLTSKSALDSEDDSGNDLLAVLHSLRIEFGETNSVQKSYHTIKI